MFFKFSKLIDFIKVYYNYLPCDIREELVDVLTYYKDLCIISKYERSLK